MQNNNSSRSTPAFCHFAVFNFVVLILLLAGATAHAQKAAEPGPFINTWLVAGTFANDAQDSGFTNDFIGEATVTPCQNEEAGGKTWRYFDDRLFSRNYDDYQDLFSYYKTKLGESVAAKVVYAHTWVYSPTFQDGQIRIGADNQCKAWFNGVEVISSTKSGPYRDAEQTNVLFKLGWNRLLVKVANKEEGRLGFYARFCTKEGGKLKGLVVSPNGEKGQLAISTQAMEDAKTGNLPLAFREWPYVGIDPLQNPDPNLEGFLRRKPHLLMHGSDFLLTVQGGQAPYRWSLASGVLPPGLKLNTEGSITGVISPDAKLGAYAFQVRVTDKKGTNATKDLSLVVKERPNKWYEEARLVALMHNPETMSGAKEGDLAEFAKLMKRQGYEIGSMISFNNGDMKYRWPNRFEPNHADTAGQFKAALEKEGLRFGMYMGNLNGPNHGGENGALLMVEEAVRRYQPAAFWFDWASPDPDGHPSLDALYSMIKSATPDALIVLNGMNTVYQGDWDVVCLEGFGAWGDQMWALWPFPIRWAKRVPVETWRMLSDPDYEHSKGIHPDWQEYMRVQLSIIGQGFVANIDHSPTIRQPYKTLYETEVMQAHRKMAEWANPTNMPSFVESFTKVNAGPFDEAAWGYNTINLSRDAIYLHIMTNALGKTGNVGPSPLVIGPIKNEVKAVRWMNQNKRLTFAHKGDELSIGTEGLVIDPIDTIIKIELGGTYPAGQARVIKKSPVPAGNLAYGKPAQLLSTDGQRILVPSALAFAQYGVDGQPATFAAGAYEWAWAYHVDLEWVHSVRKVVIRFAPKNFATEYKLLLSENGKVWQEAVHMNRCKGGVQEHLLMGVAARYVRVEAVRPNAEGQEGSQMGIGELEVYE